MAPKILTLCLAIKDYILKNWDLGMRKKIMRNYPRALMAKFFLVFIALRRDILLRSAFQEKKAKK